MKARFAMKDDKKTLNEIEFYAKILNIKQIHMIQQQLKRAT